jgi:hypothetical protein
MIIELVCRETLLSTTVNKQARVSPDYKRQEEKYLSAKSDIGEKI